MDGFSFSMVWAAVRFEIEPPHLQFGVWMYVKHGNLDMPLLHVENLGLEG